MGSEPRYRLREAVPGDEVLAMSFIDDAKEYLRSRGVDQWQRGYPDISSVEADISAGNGYFLTDGDRDLAYMCIDMGGEPAYGRIDGGWISPGPYGVMHRLAVGAEHRGRGLSSVSFSLAEDVMRSRGAVSFRVDTDGDNSVMRHILDKAGFAYCGTIWFDYSPKVAYEKIL